uniref:tRNA (guanosine(37)-N1)-methyltransferase TrmD n=1 Tax=Ndongobacter massiliensis TaxID=1871025 RepID=UPI000A41D551|nr:tRNA (guanosine(37)-N1)-methyltransferase TrmD [Ndongobacter massiliensis]
MKIDVLTLFPEVVSVMQNYGVLGRALQNGLVEMRTVCIRDFSEDRHHRVDDTVYGGAAGMLMGPQPVVDAIDSVRDPQARVIYLSPQGPVLTQQKARALASEEHLVLLCGHYEGIDARVTNHFIDEELSIGDYVLTGGELPAMVLIDAVLRWVKGVLGNEASAASDSHVDGLLQYDEYTKPRNFRGYTVPEILLNGNHAEIAAWRRQSALENTKKKRPDLYEKYNADQASEGGKNGLY